MARRLVWVFGLAVLWASLGWAQTYGPGEIYYGGIRLQFSGRLMVGGTCQGLDYPAPNISRIRCQVSEGSAGIVELRAIRTPTGTVNMRIESVPGGCPCSFWVYQQDEWRDSRSSVASGWGTVEAQYRFTVPPGSAGSTFALRFKAWAAGVIGELELQVILEAVRAVTPTPPPAEAGPSYGPFTGTTDETGRFEIPIPTLPNTGVTGKLTECTVVPLPNRPVSIALVPKPGVTALTRADQIGAVRVSSPGYPEVTITQIGLLSSMDMFGRTYTTVDVGTVCLQPTAPPVTPPPVAPTGPISGTTDSNGKFSAPLPWPGVVASGKLLNAKGQPLANHPFSLRLIPKVPSLASPGDIGEFELTVPGFLVTRITHFSVFSLFGLTSFLLGDIPLEEDELPWSANRPLTWNDFKGNSPEGADEEEEAAKIVMGLCYSFMARTWKEGGKWKAHLTEVTTTNTMKRSESWVVPRERTPALLNHEQKHFDLNEVYRRLLDAALQKLVCNLEATGDTEEEATANLEKKLDKALDPFRKKCEEVQEQYDRETDHGRNAEKQAEWDKRIAGWLADPKTAPQP